LLPAPRRQGRVGFYSEEHLARLRLIATLLERGYSLGNIAELLGAWETGQDLGDLLGLEIALTVPWSEEAPTTMSLEQLAELGAGETDQEVEWALAEAIRLGIVEPEGDHFKVLAPGIIETGMLLVGAGIPLHKVISLAQNLRDDIDVVARLFVDVFDTNLIGPDGRVPSREEIPQLATLVEHLRPLAKRVVEAELSRSMDREIQARFGERLRTLFETQAVDEAS
jgi:DNA-binding transcriptional MerR regulator